MASSFNLHLLFFIVVNKISNSCSYNYRTLGCTAWPIDKNLI